MAASVTAAAIQKKTFGSETTTLIISDEEMTSIIEIVNPLQDVEGEKSPPNNFSPVTSTNIVISSQNFLTFSFNPFATLA